MRVKIRIYKSTYKTKIISGVYKICGYFGILIDHVNKYSTDNIVILLEKDL